MRGDLVSIASSATACDTPSHNRPGKSRSGDGFKPLAAPTFLGFAQSVLNPKFLLSLNATRGSRLCPSTKQEVNIFPLMYWFNFILLLQMLPLCPRTLVWGSFLGTVISALTVFLVGGGGWKAEYNYVAWGFCFVFERNSHNIQLTILKYEQFSGI